MQCNISPTCNHSCDANDGRSFLKQFKSVSEKTVLVVWMSGASSTLLLPRSWQRQPLLSSTGGLWWPPAEGNVRCYHLQQQRQCWTNCTHLQGRHLDTFICRGWIWSCHLGPVSQAGSLDSPRLLPQKRGNSGVSLLTERDMVTPEKWD